VGAALIGWSISGGPHGALMGSLPFRTLCVREINLTTFSFRPRGTITILMAPDSVLQIWMPISIDLRGWRLSQFFGCLPEVY
jgi:hypothetical protein